VGISESDRDGEIVAQTAVEPRWFGEIVGVTADGRQYAVRLLSTDADEVALIDVDAVDAYEWNPAD
jgi:hypothetical protein